MTLAEVKAILGISGTDDDARISALLPGIEEFVRNHCNDSFAKAKPSTTAETISFDADSKTISCGDFENYRAGYQIVVEDSLYNDGVLTIDSIDTGTITVVEDLIDEDAGEEITVSETILPKIVKIVIAKIIKYQMQVKEGLVSKKLGDGSETYSQKYPQEYLDMLPRKVRSV